MYNSINIFRFNAIYKIKNIMISYYKFETIVNFHQLIAKLLHNYVFIRFNYKNFESKINKCVSIITIKINKCCVIYFIYCRYYNHRDLRHIFQKIKK